MTGGASGSPVQVPAGPPAPYGEDEVTGSTDDSRPRWDALPDQDEPLIPVRQCPHCGRSTADSVCLHCAAEGDLRGASLVRRFVNFPDLYSKDTADSPPGPDPGDRPTPGEHVPAPAPTLTQEQAARPAAGAAGAAPRGMPAVRTRHPLDPSGWGPRGILATVAIASAAILLATAVGIAGAVLTGPGDAGGPGVEASPSRGHPPGRSPLPAGGGKDLSRPGGVEEAATGPAAAPTLSAAPTSAVTGHISQGSFCLDGFAGGTGNGSPIQMRQCAATDAQRWTFATDGTMRVLGRCARPVGGEAADGAEIELWDCDGTASQQWLRGSDGSLVHPASRGCLENPATPGDAHGSAPRLAVCDSVRGQRWELPYAALSG